MRYIEQQLAFGPRYPGSTAHAQVQDWIVRELEGMGWRIERQTFEHRGILLSNIIATMPMSKSSTPIILGAHYDTRKFADRDPLFPDRPVPGANDGASGVAVLLELARVFSDRTIPDMTLVFFDAEDQGHIDEWDWDVGSRYFVDQLDQHPRAVVIVDMIGDKDLRLPVERSSNPELVRSIWGTAAMLGITEFVQVPGPGMIDDHTPFIQADIPAVLLIDFTYPYWHTTDDGVEKVSHESLSKIGTTLEGWLMSFGSEPEDASQ